MTADYDRERRAAASALAMPLDRMERWLRIGNMVDEEIAVCHDHVVTSDDDHILRAIDLLRHIRGDQ